MATFRRTRRRPLPRGDAPHFLRALYRNCVTVRAVISLLLLRRLSWALVYLWAIAVFILSSLSGSKIEQIEPFPIWDKAAHFLAYTSGAVVLALALRLSKRWRWHKVVLITAACISLFGATDELHQLATPGRSGADVRDWAADTLGALAGGAFSCAAWAIYASQRKRRS